MATKVATNTITSRFRDLLESRQEACALTFLLDGEAKEASQSFGQLGENALRVASAIVAFKSQPVLLLIAPGNEYIAAVLGCFLAGAIAVPMYPSRTPRGFSPKVQAIVNDCEPQAIITNQAFLAGITLNQKSTDAPPVFAIEELLLGPLARELPDVAPQSTAFLQYTSGSTNSPKGVMVTHANLYECLSMMQACDSADQEEIFVSWLPPFHDMGLVGNIMLPLFLGARLVHMSYIRFAEKPIRWLRTIDRYRGRRSGGPNFAYDLCVDRTSAEERTQLDLSCWRTAFNGSEPIRNSSLERFSRAFEHSGFDRSAFFPCYGLAEATLMVSGGKWSGTSIKVCSDALRRGQLKTISSPTDNHLDLISSGIPLTGQAVCIADSSGTKLHEDGVIGEICINSPTVSPGYWKQGTNSYMIGGRSYLRTGDLGAFVGAQLLVTGRIKELLIINGKKHFPTDVEQTVQFIDPLLRLNAGAVFVDPKGESAVIVVQEILRNKSGEGGERRNLMQKIRAAVFKEHQLNVASVCLVPAGVIPRTSSGKIQRALCRQMFIDGSLDEYLPTQTVEKAEFQNELEELIAQTFGDLLKRKRISRDDDFFELGLDSVTAIQGIELVSQKTKIAVSLLVLSDHSTPASLAAWISQQGSTSKAAQRTTV